jgi:hypothetical protein
VKFPRRVRRFFAYPFIVCFSVRSTALTSYNIFSQLSLSNNEVFSCVCGREILSDQLLNNSLDDLSFVWPPRRPSYSNKFNNCWREGCEWSPVGVCTRKNLGWFFQWDSPQVPLISTTMATTTAITTPIFSLAHITHLSSGSFVQVRILDHSFSYTKNKVTACAYLFQDQWHQRALWRREIVLLHKQMFEVLVVGTGIGKRYPLLTTAKHTEDRHRRLCKGRGAFVHNTWNPLKSTTLWEC